MKDTGTDKKYKHTHTHTRHRFPTQLNHTNTKPNTKIFEKFYILATDYLSPFAALN